MKKPKIRKPKLKPGLMKPVELQKADRAPKAKHKLKFE